VRGRGRCGVPAVSAGEGCLLPEEKVDLVVGFFVFF